MTGNVFFSHLQTDDDWGCFMIFMNLSYPYTLDVFPTRMSLFWWLRCTFMIVSMQLGFAMLEVGCVRQEHRMTVLEPWQLVAAGCQWFWHVQNPGEQVNFMDTNDGILGRWGDSWDFFRGRMSMTSSRCADIGIMQPLVVINHGWKMENPSKSPQFDDFPNKHPSIGDMFFGIFFDVPMEFFPSLQAKNLLDTMVSSLSFSLGCEIFQCLAGDGPGPPLGGTG